MGGFSAMTIKERLYVRYSAFLDNPGVGPQNLPNILAVDFRNVARMLLQMRHAEPSVFDLCGKFAMTAQPVAHRSASIPQLAKMLGQRVKLFFFARRPASPMNEQNTGPGSNGSPYTIPQFTPVSLPMKNGIKGTDIPQSNNRTHILNSKGRSG
jgi:hypothetical protein